MAHKVTRPCSRNGCPAPARASMMLDYAGKQVTLVPLMDLRDPRFLEVCPPHAEGMDVPRGWKLVDERDEEPTTPSGPPTAEEMGSSATVAVLAAALREAPEQDEPGPPEPIAAVPALDELPAASDLPEVVARPQPPSGRTAEPRPHAPRDERQLRLDPDGGSATDPEAEPPTTAGARPSVARPVLAARDDARPT